MRHKGNYNCATTRGWTPEQKLAFHSRRNKRTGCLVWQASTNLKGYGEIKINGVLRIAHRVAWALANNRTEPKGKCVLHRCDNPSCIEPAHLFVGTIADNNADKLAKGRQTRGEKHGTAKLIPRQVRAIRASTKSHREIAKQFGVGKTVVGSIRQGIWWRHLL